MCVSLHGMTQKLLKKVGLRMENLPWKMLNLGTDSCSSDYFHLPVLFWTEVGDVFYSCLPNAQNQVNGSNYGRTVKVINSQRC